MELHPLVLLLAGLVVLGMAVLPRLTPRWPLSTPLIVFCFGLLVFALPLGLPRIDLIAHGKAAEYLTEFAVIVALMSAGLKIDRRVGWRAWRSTWLLLAVTMPLTIAAAAVLGWWAVGLAPASALLFGAAMAPTDPCLAADVQVGPPGQGAEQEGRVGFALTSEAGLNDGLAFPFTNAAIAMALAGALTGPWMGEWLLVDVLYKIGMGLLGGWVAGKLIGRLLFGSEVLLSRFTDGLMALAATLISYGAVQLTGGYGFLAVFVAAYMIRETERNHEKHRALHHLIEQVEHLSLAAVLVLLAGAVVSGVLAPLGLEAIVVAVVLIVLVRPLAGLFAGASDLSNRAEVGVVAFFGIRGIGSLYYLAYGLNHAQFEQPELLWAMATLVVLISIVVHGVTSTSAMRYLGRRADAGGSAAT